MEQRFKKLLCPSLPRRTLRANTPEGQVHRPTPAPLKPTEPAIAKYVKKFNMVGAPFAFKDYAATDKFFAGDFIKWATPEIESTGLKYLARWEYGFRNYTTAPSEWLFSWFRGMKAVSFGRLPASRGAAR